MGYPCIKLKDNRFDGRGLRFEYHHESEEWQSNDNFGQAVSLTPDQLGVLKRFSELPVSKYPPGLVTLTGVEVNAENAVSSEKDFLYSLQGDFQTWFRIDTSNMMGHVRLYSEDRLTAVELEITSRFDKGENQLFLNYLLCTGLGVNLVSQVGGLAGGWDFLLAYLFVIKLGEVATVGLLKQYVEFRRNDFNPRGRIDIQRHIRENWPASQGIAYVKRDAVYDIPLNHLLRHAAETVFRKWPQLEDRLDDAKGMLRSLRENTPTWARNGCHATLQHKDCLSPVRHPYFVEYYEPLRVLSRVILRDEGVGAYGEGDEVSGVVFNGADLWEEYLHTVLFKHYSSSNETLFQGGEYIHANNRTRTNEIYLYRPCEKENSRGHQRIYPDFRWRCRRDDRPDYEWDVILDAKYKGLVQEGQTAPSVTLPDRCEMAQYVMATKARLCALLCPVSNEKDVRNHFAAKGWLVDGVFYGYESTVVAIPFFVPDVHGFDEFWKSMKEEEDDFKTRIESALKHYGVASQQPEMVGGIANGA